MKTIPPVHPVTEPVATLHPDARRECALVRIRQKRALTSAEVLELERITERQAARSYVADRAHEVMTEAHAFPTNPNLHDD